MAMATNGAMFDKKRSDSSETMESVIQPLDLLMMDVTNKYGIQKQVSAVHIGFMEQREYVHFQPLPSLITPEGQSINSSGEADEEEWLERIGYLEDDLHWLLKLPHHRFWSQTVHDENLQQCLQSYLSRAPRDYDLNSEVREDLLMHLQRIHKLIFLVFLRMSTYKESKMHYITPNGFGEMIYDHFVFDIPKVMDLCVLYGLKNQVILSKMIHNIFSTQPKYLEDLNETALTVLVAFDTIEEKLNLKKSLEDNELDPIKLDDRRSSALKCLPIFDFEDIINYLIDVSGTLNAFLEIFSPACPAFYTTGTALRIPGFYDLIFPPIEKELKRRMKTQEDKQRLENIKKKVVLSKTFLVKTFRNLIVSCCMQPILDARCSVGSEVNGGESTHVEEYLKVFCEVVAEKIFIHDYNQLFPFDGDLDLFSEAGIKLDPTGLNYIFSSIYNTDETEEKNVVQKRHVAPPVSQTLLSTSNGGGNVPVKNFHSLAAALTAGSMQAKNGDSDFNGLVGATAGEPDDVELVSLIHGILDVLPNFGEGFLEACLKHYAYCSEKVIDALLQSTLPEHLGKLDHNLNRQPTQIASVKEKTDGPYSVLNERRSIFDNDEFDIFNTKNVNMQNIHMGKSNKTPETYNVLNDDKDSNFLKELILSYDDGESDYNEELGIYEDEYDDTYDSTLLGIGEPQREDEIQSIRPFTTPRVLQSHKREEASDPEDTEVTEEEPAKPAVNRNNFCENPETIRQRAEERWQSKMRNRGGRHNMPGGAQGQEKSKTLQNKERHKGQAANHNRRKQADFKKSRGMVPFPTR